MDLQNLIIKLKEENYTISTSKDMLQTDVIYNYLKRSYWAEGVPYKIVERAINNSFTFGVYYKSNQVGFARLITDFAVFAHLADLFILKEYRGKGLSKWLMYEIKNHPKLQKLRKWTLATIDAHGLYKQFGFTEIQNPAINMEIYNPDIYKKDE